MPDQKTVSKVFYPLVLDDAKRNLSKRPGQFHDCTVRAFAIVTGLDYDTVYETLAREGRKPCQGFDSTTWLKKRRGRAFGGIFKPVKVTGRDDRYTQRPHLTPLNFGVYHPRGRYLLEFDNHVWCVINSVHHDLWRVKQEKPLSGAWEFVS